jgi:hypothetical protein
MANSIVFQNSAAQLKTAIYGFDSVSSSYKALKVNTAGELYVIAGTINQIGTIKYVAQIGTLKYVAPIGTLKYAEQIGTLKYVAPIGTLKYVAPIGTLKYAEQIGTLKYVAPIGTLKYAEQIGTLKYVAPIGTLKYAEQIGTLKYVAPIGTLKYAEQIGTLKYVAPIGTLKYVNQIGTINGVTGTLKVNLVDRYFNAITQTIQIGTNTSTYTDLIDISKYQQTSWYLRNITAPGRTAVTVELAATPSNDLTNYPLVLIQETATVNANPELITNDRYIKWVTAKITNPSTATLQDVVVVFNGRY